MAKFRRFLFWRGLKRSLAQRGTPLKSLPRIDGKQVKRIISQILQVAHLRAPERRQALAMFSEVGAHKERTQVHRAAVR